MFRRPRAPSRPLPVLAEFRDVSSPADASRVAAEFGREPNFGADLLRVRPWLPAHLSPREVPLALLESEWTGFLALLDERGPWVYVSSISAWQELTRLYLHFFQAVPNPGVGAGTSLIERLDADATPELQALEAKFWARAGDLAAQRYAVWSRR